MKIFVCRFLNVSVMYVMKEESQRMQSVFEVFFFLVVVLQTGTGSKMSSWPDTNIFTTRTFRVLTYQLRQTFDQAGQHWTRNE